MKVVHRSLIYDAPAQPENRRVAFFTSLLRVASGNWLAGFTAGPTKHHPTATIFIRRSRDGGQTWEDRPFSFVTTQDGIPGSLTGTELVETQPGRLLLFATWFDRTDPDRPLFDPDTEGLLRSRQLVASSTDEGATWSDWRVVPTPGLTGTALTGPILRWPDGTIGFPFESFKEFDDPSPVQHGAWMMVSRDGGASFEKHLVAQDPNHRIYYWDQRLCIGREPGDYLGLLWTHDRTEKRDRNVHVVRGNLAVDASRRVQPIETAIPGQIASPLLLNDGRLLAFVVDRRPPGTMRLWTSRNGGRTWPVNECLTVHEHQELARLSQGAGVSNVDFAQYWEDMAKWSFGHPVIRPLDERHILAAYYAGTPGCLSVHAAEIEV